MKSKKKLFRLMGITMCLFVLFSFPICSLAAEQAPTIQIPQVTDTIPDDS